MSTTLSLPPVLRARLLGVARRVRVLRALRGVGLLMLLLAFTAGAALAADWAFELAAPVRQVLFVAWTVLAVLLATFGILQPLARRLDPAALAAAVEEQHPELGERLTSSVELADTQHAGHGSRDLIALLIRDTERRVGTIDFLPAVSGRSAGLVALAGLAVLALVLAPAVVAPTEYAQLAQRFFLPWYTPPVVPPYALTVTPGDDLFAARGRPLSLTVQVTPTRDGAVLPTECYLVRTNAAGVESRLPMTA